MRKRARPSDKRRVFTNLEKDNLAAEWKDSSVSMADFEGKKRLPMMMMRTEEMVRVMMVTVTVAVVGVGLLEVEIEEEGEEEVVVVVVQGMGVETRLWSGCGVL